METSRLSKTITNSSTIGLVPGPVGIADTQINNQESLSDGYLSDVPTHHSNAPSEISQDLVASTKTLEKHFKDQYQVLRSAYEERVRNMNEMIQTVCLNVISDDVLQEMKHDKTSSAFIPPYLNELLSNYLDSEREKYVHQILQKVSILEAENSALKKQTKRSSEELHDRLIKAEVREKNLLFQLNQMTESTKSLEDERKQLIQTIYKRDEDIRQLQSSIALNQQEITSMELLDKEEKQYYLQLKDKYMTLIQEKQIIQEEKQTLSFQVQSLANKLDILNQSKQEESYKLSSQHQQFTQLMSQVEKLLSQEIEDSNTIISTINQKMQQFKKRMIQDLQHERSLKQQFELQSHEWQKKYESLEPEKEKHLQLIQKYNEDIKLKQQQLQSSKELLEIQEKEIQEKTRKNTELENKIKELESFLHQQEVKSLTDINQIKEKMQFDYEKKLEQNLQYLDQRNQAFRLHFSNQQDMLHQSMQNTTFYQNEQIKTKEINRGEKDDDDEDDEDYLEITLPNLKNEMEILSMFQKLKQDYKISKQRLKIQLQTKHIENIRQLQEQLFQEYHNQSTVFKQQLTQERDQYITKISQSLQQKYESQRSSLKNMLQLSERNIDKLTQMIKEYKEKNIQQQNFIGYLQQEYQYLYNVSKQLVKASTVSEITTASSTDKQDKKAFTQTDEGISSRYQTFEKDTQNNPNSFFSPLKDQFEAIEINNIYHNTNFQKDLTPNLSVRDQSEYCKIESLEKEVQSDLLGYAIDEEKQNFQSIIEDLTSESENLKIQISQMQDTNKALNLVIDSRPLKQEVFDCGINTENYFGETNSTEIIFSPQSLRKAITNGPISDKKQNTSLPSLIAQFPEEDTIGETIVDIISDMNLNPNHYVDNFLDNDHEENLDTTETKKKKRKSGSNSDDGDMESPSFISQPANTFDHTSLMITKLQMEYEEKLSFQSELHEITQNELTEQRKLNQTLTKQYQVISRFIRDYRSNLVSELDEYRGILKKLKYEYLQYHSGLQQEVVSFANTLRLQLMKSLEKIQDKHNKEFKSQHYQLIKENKSELARLEARYIEKVNQMNVQYSKELERVYQQSVGHGESMLNISSNSNHPLVNQAFFLNPSSQPNQSDSSLNIIQNSSQSNSKVVVNAFESVLKGVLKALSDQDCFNPNASVNEIEDKVLSLAKVHQEPSFAALAAARSLINEELDHFVNRILQRKYPSEPIMALMTSPQSNMTVVNKDRGNNFVN